ncbi:hypothetical protein [Streptomyces bacillaris]|uniref:hypothetical protein n=1 Tax=Streptomyces bacillaris TaxID=68179 RepID=UPI003650F055
MSYDLAFWQENLEIDASEAFRKYDAMTDGASGVFAESENVRAFHRALRDIHPDLTIENAEMSPWTSPVYGNGECVLVTIAWSRKDELVEGLIPLARKHGLLTYDPQQEEVHQQPPQLLKPPRTDQ